MWTTMSRAQFDRPLKVRRHERIVDDNAAVGLMRNGGDRANVRDRHHGFVGVSMKTMRVFGADGVRRRPFGIDVFT